MTLKGALLHPHRASNEIRRVFDTIDAREERVELNLYVSGYEDEPEEAAATHREPPAETSVPETSETNSETESS